MLSNINENSYSEAILALEALTDYKNIDTALIKPYVYKFNDKNITRCLLHILAYEGKTTLLINILNAHPSLIKHTDTAIGFTLLHIAAYKDDLLLTNYLLQYYTNQEIQNLCQGENETLDPIDQALNKKSPTEKAEEVALAILSKIYPNKDNPFASKFAEHHVFLAIHHNFKKILKKLLQLKPELIATAKFAKNNLLSFTLIRNREELLDILIQFGALDDFYSIGDKTYSLDDCITERSVTCESLEQIQIAHNSKNNLAMLYNLISTHYTNHIAPRLNSANGLVEKINNHKIKIIINLRFKKLQEIVSNLSVQGNKKVSQLISDNALLYKVSLLYLYEEYRVDLESKKNFEEHQSLYNNITQDYKKLRSDIESLIEKDKNPFYKINLATLLVDDNNQDNIKQLNIIVASVYRLAVTCYNYNDKTMEKRALKLLLQLNNTRNRYLAQFTLHPDYNIENFNRFFLIQASGTTTLLEILTDIYFSAKKTSYLQKEITDICKLININISGGKYKTPVEILRDSPPSMTFFSESSSTKPSAPALDLGNSNLTFYPEI